jgi:hypothetical protein
MRQQMSRRIAVARQIVDVGRALRAFDFEGEQYLSWTVHKTMLEAERAYSRALDEDQPAAAAAHYDRAEHLAKVVSYLVRREAPKFAANPKAWIEKRRELQI